MDASRIGGQPPVQHSQEQGNADKKTARTPESTTGPTSQQHPLLGKMPARAQRQLASGAPKPEQDPMTWVLERAADVVRQGGTEKEVLNSLSSDLAKHPETAALSRLAEDTRGMSPEQLKELIRRISSSIPDAPQTQTTGTTSSLTPIEEFKERVKGSATSILEAGASNRDVLMSLASDFARYSETADLAGYIRLVTPNMDHMNKEELKKFIGGLV